MARVPQALKDRVPILYHQQEMSVKRICRVLGLRKSTAYHALQYHQKYGVSSKPSQVQRRRKLTTTDVIFLMSLLDQSPTLFLDEIQSHLYRQRKISVSIATLTRTLRRIDYTNKNVSREAIERDQIRRAAFMNHIGEIITNPDMLMFTDESSVDRRTMARRKGWAKAGNRCVQRHHFIRGQRYSVLPVLTINGIVA